VGGFIPVNEGPIVDLVIADNVVEQMNHSGISILTLLALPDVEDFVTIQSARIDRNRIVRNLRAPSQAIAFAFEDFLPFTGSAVALTGAPSGFVFPGSTFRGDLQRLPLGGIVLGAVDRLQVRDNVVEDNGTDSPINVPISIVVPNTSPICGLFVLVGDQIEIAGNRFVNNGVVALADTEGPLEPGIRAGIAVVLAGTGTDRNIFNQVENGSAFVPDTLGPSLRVTGNTVEHPEGRALYATATGPVMVQGNSLSSRGYHGADNVEDALAIGDVVLIQNLGRPWESTSFPTSAGDDDIPALAIPYLSSTPSTINTFVDPLYLFFVGTGGHVLFTDNQVTYDWDVVRVPVSPPDSVLTAIGNTSALDFRLSYFSAAVVSLDHVTVADNQFAMRMNATNVDTSSLDEVSLLSHVLAAAASVDVRGNRVAEGVEIPATGGNGDATPRVPADAEVSIASFGFMMNTTAFNTGTHCSLGFTPVDELSLPPIARKVVDFNSALVIPSGGCVNTNGDGGSQFFRLLQLAESFFKMLIAVGTRADQLGQNVPPALRSASAGVGTKAKAVKAKAKKKDFEPPAAKRPAREAKRKGRKPGRKT
jgi:hypothetical protein